MKQTLLALCCALGFSAVADEMPMRALDSVIFLTKNTNHNQVHYGVHVDEQCRPLEDEPVYAYWRMLEEGPDGRAELSFWEEPGYGVRQPKHIERSPEEAGGDSLELVIRGVPERVIQLKTTITEEGCVARAFTSINGNDALLDRIDIHVSGWATVHKVEIHGVSATDGLAVSEITHQD
jgi:hypothetical protein